MENTTKTIYIGGMTCTHCQNIIEKALKATNGISTAKVSYKTNQAEITYDPETITETQIAEIIENLDYTVLKAPPKTPLKNIIFTLAIIIILFIIIKLFSTSSLAVNFPTAQAGMGYGMVLIIGLLTSVHCIAMCGGINLSQSLSGIYEDTPKNNKLKKTLPALLYNLGRLISYTLVGVVVGAIGSVITITSGFGGIVLLLAGIFMLVMGFNMLGLFPWLKRFSIALPARFGNQSGHGPQIIVGFLNGFMPCGPLQAMQLYALSTGNPVTGGISMFLFCLGTTPLMFGFGALSSIFSGIKGQAVTRKIMYIGAIVIAAMGLTMIANGWTLSGLKTPFTTQQVDTSNLPQIQNGTQIVNSTLLPNQYPQITVRQGIPVRWTINAPEGSINGCNNRIFIHEYDIEHTFHPGENIIEFTPHRTGRFTYSCWMGMISSNITVIDDNVGTPLAASDIASDIPTQPAGVMIYSDSLTVATISDNHQTLKILLTDYGFEPAVAVLQRNIPANIQIKITSTDPGNTALLFPAFKLSTQTQIGENTISLTPKEDFDLCTLDYVYFAFVKVVDNVTDIDTDEILFEAMLYETLVYPQEYFE